VVFKASRSWVSSARFGVVLMIEVGMGLARLRGFSGAANDKVGRCRFILASSCGIAFSPRVMSSLPTADLLALDTAGLKSRLSKLRRYL
jgi:hypothetical protein